MARDVSETVREALANVAREALKNAGTNVTPQKKKSPLSGAKGVAAGAGLAALAPLAAKKGFEAVRANGGLPTPSPTRLASMAGDRVGSRVKDAVGDKVDQAGGAGGLLKEAASGLLPGGSGDSGGKDGMPGVGKGRRMPVQQSVDVAVPLETAYNQWTQYEDWPEFMHRVTRVTQEEESSVRFATKIWGKTKEFEAKIETQRPDDRVKWHVSQGISHAGVVSFHELAPKLTRIELTLDVEPGGLLEKAARGMRHIKRAVRADMNRFKAFIEMQEHETGAWRGVIENGEVVEEHDESYDDKREYSEVEDIFAFASHDEDEEQEEDESQRSRTERFKRQAERSRSGASSSSRRGSGSSSSSRSRSGSSSSSSRGTSGSSRGGSSSSSSGRSRSAAASKSSSTRSTGGTKRGGSSSSGSSKSSGNGRASSKRSSSSSSSGRKSKTAS
jgi:uncharacterized membrane protein